MIQALGLPVILFCEYIVGSGTPMVMRPNAYTTGNARAEWYYINNYEYNSDSSTIMSGGLALDISGRGSAGSALTSSYVPSISAGKKPSQQWRLELITSK